MKIQEVLLTATDIVGNKRQEEYNQSTPTAMHIRIATVWSGILDHEVTPHEVALCMAGLKLVRAASSPGHEDSYVDTCGYAAIAAEIMHEEDAPVEPGSIQTTMLTNMIDPDDPQ